MIIIRICRAMNRAAPIDTDGIAALVFNLRTPSGLRNQCDEAGGQGYEKGWFRRGNGRINELEANHLTVLRRLVEGLANYPAIQRHVTDFEIINAGNPKRSRGRIVSQPSRSKVR